MATTEEQHQASTAVLDRRARELDEREAAVAAREAQYRGTFIETLSLLERGVLNRQLTDEMRDLTERVALHKKAGTIAIKLTVKPDDDEQQLKIVAAYAAKPPTAPRKASTFFIAPDGALTRNYPGQMTAPALGGEED